MEAFNFKGSRCQDLASPSITNFVISWILVIGILISYLPQHYRIIARRSSAGISPYFILLGSTSSTCAVANILVLPLTRTDFKCCEEISPFACTAALLGIAQVGMQWSCFFLIMLLFLIFFPRSTSTTSAARSSATSSPNAATSSSASPSATTTSPLPPFRDALIVVSTSLLFLILIFLTSIFTLANHSSHAQRLADVLGLGSTLLASIQYIPQLYTTWRLQSVLSLSIPMMLIQTPGSFLWAASLAARLGWEGWSAWAVYGVTGCLQGILLGMGIAFEVRDWRKRNGGRGMGGASNDNDNGSVASSYASAEGHFDENEDIDELRAEDEHTPLLRRGSPG